MAAKKSILQQYRLLPLIGVGLAFLIILVTLSLLIWAFVAYQGRLDIAADSALPAVIYLGGVFLSAVLMTALIRGGTVFPALVVSLIAALLSLLLADSSLVTFGHALGKILLTLLAGVIGFTLAKLYFVGKQPRTYIPPRQARPSPTDKQQSPAAPEHEPQPLAEPEITLPLPNSQQK